MQDEDEQGARESAEEALELNPDNYDVNYVRAIKVIDFERHHMVAVRCKLDHKYVARDGLARKR